MNRFMNLIFNIFLTDDFEEAVRVYAERKTTDDITNEDIVEYINQHIVPARSEVKTFEVEGGDTDGWFVQGIERI